MSRPRRKVLFVTRNLPPLTGGMEALLYRTILALCEKVPVDLIGPSGVRARVPEACTVLAEIPFSSGRFLPEATVRTLVHADPGRYQLCFGGSGLMAPVLRAARVRGLATGVYLHGLDLAFRSPIYQRLFVASLPATQRVIANSRYTRNLAIAKGISECSITVVNPGVEVPVEVGRGARVDELRHRWGSGPVLLSVGRLVARKGVAEFVARCLPALVARHPDLKLLVVGGEPPGGKGHQIERIMSASRHAGLADSVHLLGKVSEQDLLALYSLADIHVLPLVDIPGDVEGFGMVILEAAAHGVPSVAFDLGGVSDAMDSECGGCLVQAGNYFELTLRLLQVLRERPGAEVRTRLIDKTRNRSWRRFGDEVVRALEIE